MIGITRGVSGDCPGSCACPELCEAQLCRQVELETTAPALRASSVCLASGPSPAGTRFPGGMSPASVRCWATGGRAGLVQQPRRTSTHLHWASGGLTAVPPASLWSMGFHSSNSRLEGRLLGPPRSAPWWSACVERLRLGSACQPPPWPTSAPWRGPGSLGRDRLWCATLQGRGWRRARHSRP